MPDNLKVQQMTRFMTINNMHLAFLFSAPDLE